MTVYVDSLINFGSVYSYYIIIRFWVGMNLKNYGCVIRIGSESYQSPLKVTKCQRD